MVPCRAPAARQKGFHQGVTPMTFALAPSRGLRIAMALSAVLFLAACASKSQVSEGLGGAGAGGAATPGSPQDFVVNVGDRVFFAEDQSDLSDQARTTLGQQARWLQAYPRYTVTIEGHADER
eukprot:gene5464-7233_t